MKKLITILFFLCGCISFAQPMFTFNASQISKTFHISGTYIDVKGRVYKDSVVLAPFTSVVLLKDSISVLPVVFSSFTAIASGKTNVIAWSVANEINVNYYDIQRSGDGKTFLSIGSRIVGTIYSFVDNAPAKTEYYRIAEVDLSGGKIYTVILFVQNSNIVPPPPPPHHRAGIFAAIINFFIRLFGGSTA